MLCDKNIFGETYLFTPGREPRTDQSIDIIKVQLGEPMSFIGVIYRRRNGS